MYYAQKTDQNLVYNVIAYCRKGFIPLNYPILKALFHLSKESTRKLAARIFIQSQCLKVDFNDMYTLAASLQVAFAIGRKELLHAGVSCTKFE